MGKRYLIESVAVVGGIVGFENDPTSNDYKHVNLALDYLRKSGIAVSSKPDFDSVNFAQERNFLDECRQYDAILIAHIPNGRNLPFYRIPFIEFSPGSQTSDLDQLSITIDRNGNSDKWAKRIEESGAKVVLTVGSCLEVEQHFLSASRHFNAFKTVITPTDNPTLIAVQPESEAVVIRKIYGSQLDVPYPWLGISVRKDWEPLVDFNTQTDLGKRLIA